MANTNAPFGLRPAMHTSGVNIVTGAYTIASEYSTSIFTGDPVKLTGTGRNIAICGQTDAAIGVFAGCQYVNSKGEQVFSQYWPASTAATEIVANVVNDKGTIFEVQADTFAAADMATPYVTLATTAGSTVTGQAGNSVLNSSKSSSTSSKTMQVIGLVDRPDNAYGAYAKLLVKLL
jgi:hypothetical protein